MDHAGGTLVDYEVTCYMYCLCKFCIVDFVFWCNTAFASLQLLLFGWLQFPGLNTWMLLFSVKFFSIGEEFQVNTYCSAVAPFCWNQVCILVILLYWEVKLSNHPLNPSILSSVKYTLSVWGYTSKVLHGSLQCPVGTEVEDCWFCCIKYNNNNKA